MDTHVTPTCTHVPVKKFLLARRTREHVSLKMISIGQKSHEMLLRIETKKVGENINRGEEKKQKTKKKCLSQFSPRVTNDLD
jgi:hypothetical protein